MACSAALFPCSEARQCSMILALAWASPSIVSLLKSGGWAPLCTPGTAVGSPSLKLSQPEQQEAGHCVAEPFPDLVQSAVPDRPWRRSTGRRGNHGATRQQAAITGRWLRSEGMRALYASPIRRAHEPTGCIASITGLTIQPDARLRERLNWDGDQPFDAFLTLWSATARGRDLSARGRRVSTASGRAGAGFPRRPAGPGRTVAALTHGGVTTELVRTLLSDDAQPSRELDL